MGGIGPCAFIGTVRLPGPTGERAAQQQSARARGAASRSPSQDPSSRCSLPQVSAPVHTEAAITKCSRLTLTHSRHSAPPRHSSSAVASLRQSSRSTTATGKRRRRQRKRRTRHRRAEHGEQRVARARTHSNPAGPFFKLFHQVVMTTTDVSLVITYLVLWQQFATIVGAPLTHLVEHQRHVWCQHFLVENNDSCRRKRFCQVFRAPVRKEVRTTAILFHVRLCFVRQPSHRSCS